MSDDASEPVFDGILIARIDDRVTQLIESLKAARKSTDRRQYYAAIAMMARAIESKDDYTARHTERVALYSLVLFDMLVTLPAFKSIDNERMRHAVKVSALLHDVGKVIVRDEVLKKPGKLTETEFAEIKSHPCAGYEIACCVEEVDEILDGIRHHHERPDGKGYPDGLKGDEIPVIAALIAVADCYDAMTSDRPYRKALTRDAAAAEIVRWKGAQFTDYAVEAFRKAYEKGYL